MPLGLANFCTTDDPRVRAGLVADGLVHDLPSVLGRPYATLADVYDDWARVNATIRAGLPALDAGVPIDAVTVLAPSLNPSALYFAGFNYRDHVSNMMKVFNLPDDPDPKSVGLKPWHGQKPRNSLCGHRASVVLPTPGVDWEIELAAVIGISARHVPIDAALEYVAGYTVGVDLSARDRAFRPHTRVESVARMDWIAQKGFEGACPLGPWLVPAFAIPDPQSLWLKLSVNGAMKQDSNTREMIFSVAEAISHLSSMITLSPGDIILTGTPMGTGAERGEALKPGDIIRASIEHIGELVVHAV